MTFAGINKLFTDEVARYLAMGYTINCGTMNGTQGEIAKVELTNGKEIIRVLLETNFINLRDCVEIKVGRYKRDAVKPNCGNRPSTVWNDDLEIISSDVYWKVTKRDAWWSSSEWYATDEEAKAIKEKQVARAKARTGGWNEKGNRHYDSDVAKRIVLPFVRRQKGCKTAKLSDISGIQKMVSADDNGKVSSSYLVYARGNGFFLH